MEIGTDDTSNATVERSAPRLACGRSAPTSSRLVCGRPASKASRSNSNRPQTRSGQYDADGGGS